MGNTRYEFINNNNDMIAAKLLYVTSATYEGDWASLTHTHYFSELFYVKSGKGEFYVEDKKFPIAKNDLVIVNPNVEHTETSLSSTPLEYLILGVENLSFTFKNNNDFAIFNCDNNKDHLMFYFTTLLKEIDEKNDRYERICQDLLEVLIINLIRYNNFSFDITPSAKTNRNCSKLKRYIDSNFSREITLDELAEKAHLNKYYLVHAFTNTYGVSPMSYLSQKRIETCKELLSSTDHSIAEISRLSGFSSQSYFSQSFKNSCGMTPGTYRKMVRKN